jgi:glycosyltransferase involved in cell wall biosynthesis
MKVCVLATSYWRHVGDNSGAFIFGLTRELVKKGVQVTVVAPHDETTISVEEVDGIQIRRYAYFFPRRLQGLCYKDGIVNNLRQRPWVILQLPLWLLAALKETWKSGAQCDVLHAFWSLPGLVAIVAGRLRGQPVVLTTFGVEVFVRNRFSHMLSRWLFRRVDTVIAISQNTRQGLLEIGSPRRCEVIPFGVDLETHLVPEAETQLQKRLGIAKNTKVVFALGRLVERKGFKHLVQAMVKVTCRTPACLVIGGSGPCREDLSALAATLGLHDIVFLPGFITAEDLPLFYQGSHVFVLPSIEDAAGETEGLGVVLLEAQVYEKPIIGSRVGGILDIIEDGKNGFLVEPEDEETLAERIITLLTNEALASQMGRVGRERLEQRFSWKYVTSRLIDTYMTILSQVEE